MNKSPTPELSTTNAANEVVPETEATATVPKALLTSSDARGIYPSVPMPTKPVPPGLIAKFWFNAVVIVFIPLPVKLRSAPFPDNVRPVVPEA